MQVYFLIIHCQLSIVNCIISGRDGGIRTPDPLLPRQVRYQAALHPAKLTMNSISQKQVTVNTF